MLTYNQSYDNTSTSLQPLSPSTMFTNFECRNELVEYASLYIDARRTQADLALVGEARAHNLFWYTFNVNVVKDDAGILAAQLHACVVKRKVNIRLTRNTLLYVTIIKRLVTIMPRELRYKNLYSRWIYIFMLIFHRSQEPPIHLSCI